MRLSSVRRRAVTLLCAALALASLARPAAAEDYVLGAEDVISVSVWLHPELERTVTISADGNITLPPVGELKAAGLTTKQLGERIGDRMSAYLRQTTTVTVTVTRFMRRSVYVSGSVASPGRYGFERIPSIVEVLGAAGGALTGARLDDVQVVRNENGVRRAMSADVASAMRDGDTSRLPELKPGDMVIVTGVVQGNAGGGGSITSGAGVIGQVGHPGIIAVGEGADLWAVLAAAGGTTMQADLRNVRILTRSETGISVTTYDLQTVLEKGSRRPVTVKTGDIVVVMPRGQSLWGGVSQILGASLSVLNVLVLIDYLSRSGGF